MDVKCENCGTEYEFDDDKVTAAGITVKCTHCGHLFRVARASPSQVAVDTEDELPRRRHWMIRNRHGEIREFRDLATLQQWIVDRKVAPDDEISKTGESWKPLGSIVELSSFFRLVEARPDPEADLFVEAEIFTSAQPRPRPVSSAPASAVPPPFAAEQVMGSGRFRLEGPQQEPVALKGARLPQRGSGPPMPSTPLDTSPTVPIARVHPSVQVRRTPHAVQARAQNPRAAATPAYAFEGEAPYGQRRHEAGRGFLLGVLASVAVAGAAYFVFDQFVRGDRAEHSQPAPGKRASGELFLTMERAEAEYENDNEQAFARADADFGQVLTLLGDPPRDKSLAARAHLGRARVALTRAEYRKLEGGDAVVLLKAAESHLAEASRLDEAEPGVALGYADFYRISGMRQRAQKFLTKVAAAGVDSDEANLVRAAMSVHQGDWGSARAQLRKLPQTVLERPRARYLLALTYARAGETESAVHELTQLLARHQGHGPARRLLQRLSSQEAPPSAAPVAPQTVTPKAPRSVVAAPRSAAPRPATPRSAGAARKAPAPKGFDAMMDRARKAQENGRNTLARRLFLQALSARPGNPEALASLGWCDVDDGDFARAISYFRRALGQHPGYADARYGLAKALEKAGRKQEALEAYQAYLRRHPRGRRADMIKRRVESLGGG